MYVEGTQVQVVGEDRAIKTRNKVYNVYIHMRERESIATNKVEWKKGTHKGRINWMGLGYNDWAVHDKILPISSSSRIWLDATMKICHHIKNPLI